MNAEQDTVSTTAVFRFSEQHQGDNGSEKPRNEPRNEVIDLYEGSKEMPQIQALLLCSPTKWLDLLPNMASGAVSPSSSPRLPSPPPMAEDQTGPQSPIPASSSLTHHSQQTSATSSAHVDSANAARRIRPGTRSIEMLEGPPLVALGDIDSPFQLTEHLKALHYHHTHPSPATTAPITRATAQLLSTCPPGIEKPLWLYELCRFLVGKANIFVVSLFADSPPCSATTCPEMRASEWQYLCAVHDPPKSCCAIDYCCHTLDWAGNTLTSPRNFPSRLVLGIPSHVKSGSVESVAQQTGSPGSSASSQINSSSTSNQQQMRQLTNIFRRVYRIFAHAWFQHREVFWRVEGRTGLYTLFKTVCDVYQLIPEDNYTIPPEAEGLESAATAADSPPLQSSPPVEALADGPQRSSSVIKDSAKPNPGDSRPSSILRRGQADVVEETSTTAADGAAVATKLMTPGTSVTARRHKHSPSKGAPVSTVVEENEEEEEPVKKDATDGNASDVESIVTTFEAPTATLTGSAGATADDVGAAAHNEPAPPVITADEPADTAPAETKISGLTAISNAADAAVETATPSVGEASTETITLLGDAGGDTAEAVSGVETTKSGESVGVNGTINAGAGLDKPDEQVTATAVGES